METSQVALKLMLDRLGVPPAIASVSDRKTVQKTVYLGQIGGVDLGYRFNWYRMGPYSPGLARDYFALAGALEGGGTNEASTYELRAPVEGRLTSLRPILDVPDGVELNRAEWLELVASTHFLLTRRRMDPEQARATLEAEKPHVVSFMDRAVEALQNRGLLPS